MKTVKDVVFCLEFEWLLSCGNDKYFQWHSTSTGNRLGGYNVSSWCTCLQYPFALLYFYQKYFLQLAVTIYFMGKLNTILLLSCVCS